MAIQTYGQGIWGIDSDEQSMLTNSISFNFASQKGEVNNKDGETVGVTVYNEVMTGTFEASYPDASSYTTASLKIGASITLANSAPNHLAKAPVTVIIDSIDVSRSNDGYATISVNYTGYPYVTAQARSSK